MTYPSVVTLAVTIDGTNVEDEIFGGGVRIISKLGQMTDTCKFVLDNPDTAPVDWNEIIVTNSGTKIFAGYVVTHESFRDPDKAWSLMYEVDCSDYSVLFEKVIVKEEYEDQTDAFIINDIVTSESQLSGFDGSTNVAAIKTHERKRYNRKTFYEVMDDLANDAQAFWYVDENKAVHFFASEENSAPYNLSDDPDLVTTFPFNRLKIFKDGTQVINVVEVVGGDFRSDNTTTERKGTGEDNRILLPYKMHKPTTDTSITVERNDGTEGTPVWTELTVKVAHVDTLSSTDDVLHYFQDAMIEQTDNWPAFENAVRITGQYDVPLRVRVRDAGSIAFYGREHEGKIVDQSLTTKPAGKLAATALLAKYSLATTVVECEAREPGLKAGQKIQLTDTLQGLTAADYLIHSVTTEIGTGGFQISDLELGTFDPDLVDIILKLVRSTSEQIIWRDDEVLDEILDILENMTISEGIPDFSARETGPISPYIWGAVPSTDEGIWDFSTWGGTAVAEYILIEQGVGDRWEVDSGGDLLIVNN